MARLGVLGSTAFSVFARNGERWKTRVFAPGEGIAEDPATGAAAGPQAVHLARYGKIQFGDEVVIEQGAEIGRPSTLHACAFGSTERLERVEVGGGAVVVARGEFRLP
jgi:trans-2,3-dihydro-3-hydroxyanthranilate isomerase